MTKGRMTKEQHDEMFESILLPLANAEVDIADQCTVLAEVMAFMVAVHHPDDRRRIRDIIVKALDDLVPLMVEKAIELEWVDDDWRTATTTH